MVIWDWPVDFIVLVYPMCLYHSVDQVGVIFIVQLVSSITSHTYLHKTQYITVKYIATMQTWKTSPNGYCTFLLVESNSTTWTVLSRCFVILCGIYVVKSVGNILKIHVNRNTFKYITELHVSVLPVFQALANSGHIIATHTSNWFNYNLIVSVLVDFVAG